MKLRTSLLVTAFVALPLLAACSDDSSADTTVSAPPGEQPVETDPPTSSDAPAGDGFQHPTGADDAVVRIATEGGFVPAGADFSRVPTLVVAGDGGVYTPGATTLEYPGPLLLPVQRATLSEDGIQALLGFADDQGLLAEAPEYPRNDQIADAPDTVVEITVDGTTYRHQAYALGLDGGAASETDAGRQALAEFVEAASNLAGVVPEGSLSEAELLSGDLEIQATPVVGDDGVMVDDTSATDTDTSDSDTSDTELAVEPTFVAWTSSTGVTLADAAECAVVPASDTEATALLTDARANTSFTEGDATYTVAVRHDLPGDTC